MVNILLGIIKADFKERLLADSYLERGYYNSLFKKTYNGYIIGTNNTEVNTLKDATSQAKEVDKADKTDNRTETPTLQSP